MTAQKCVVEGCDMEYDVVCSFSFYNANVSSDNEKKRQDWIQGAMQDESECLWRHVSLQLCGYHFEMDNQGLWIDSPMLPELLTQQRAQYKQSPADKKIAEIISIEHDYSAKVKCEPEESVSRLNVRQLVDTLGYLSLKNLQRKQLWVVKVETDKAEASITQSEQVITKLPDPRQIIEIIPQSAASTSSASQTEHTEVLHMMDDSTIPENFIYEIAEEQEITMDEVKDITSETQEWTVNILPDDTKPKYAYIKHCNTGKKKRHFTANLNEITLDGNFENYYILPDVDPSVGVEITTSCEPQNYIVEEYQHLVLEDRPKKRGKDVDGKRKKKKLVKDMKQLQISGSDDWAIQGSVSFEEDTEFEDTKKPRVRRKNQKYEEFELC